MIRQTWRVATKLSICGTGMVVHSLRLHIPRRGSSSDCITEIVLGWTLVIPILFVKVRKLAVILFAAVPFLLAWAEPSARSSLYLACRASDVSPPCASAEGVLSHIFPCLAFRRLQEVARDRLKLFAILIDGLVLVSGIDLVCSDVILAKGPPANMSKNMRMNMGEHEHPGLAFNEHEHSNLPHPLDLNGPSCPAHEDCRLGELPTSIRIGPYYCTEVGQVRFQAT